MAARAALARRLLAAGAVAVLMAGCGGTTEVAEQGAVADSGVRSGAVSTADPTPAADSAQDGTPGRPATATGPGATGGRGGKGGNAGPEDPASSAASCASQPKTFAPMSEATFAKLRSTLTGFHIEVMDSTTVSGIVSPKKAAGRPPSADCGGTRLESWEIALGRITTDLPCKVGKKPKSALARSVDGPYDYGGPCKKLRENALEYVVVRRYFGDSRPVSCPFGDCLRHNVRSMGWSFIDARSGKYTGGGALN